MPTWDEAERIWRAAVDAVRPGPLLARAVASRRAAILAARRILVVGAGKAGAAMAVALEEALGEQLAKTVGVVNVPAGAELPTRRIRLHAARPAGSNHPTEAGVVGSREMLALARSAGPEDLGLCLLSGGGSALLPAPADGITLADKQEVTRLLHACGATINEMNAVRKHLSAIKGGHLAEAFGNCELLSLILSDVVGDPLDVIASGPTAPDPTTFADAWAVIERHRLVERLPSAVRDRFARGLRSDIGDTPKEISPRVSNVLLGSNAVALTAAEGVARELGYAVVNLGPALEGETRDVAIVHAGIVRAIREHGWPSRPPVCLLSGGETTVTLGPGAGKGGRNQEFVLALLAKLGPDGMRGVVALSGGTDGEDGPTDAAGATADAQTLARADALGLRPRDALARHDAYRFFERAGGLLVSGPTQTNVMDVRVILVGG